MRGMIAYCLNCGEYVQFEGEPITVKTRIGARRRLVGICAECGHKVTRFLPSENGPTVHSVRVGATTLRGLQRASCLLELSQRAIVESILSEHLCAFVGDQLVELNRAGLIRGSELARRRRELAKPVEDWTPPERGRTAAVEGPQEPSRLWRLLFGEGK